MRVSAVFVLCGAGMASASAAQEFSLSLTGAPSTVDNSSGSVVVTINVVGRSTFGTHMLGGGFALFSDSAVIEDIQWQPSSWLSFNDDGGYAGNGNYGAVVFGQLVIPGVPPFDVPAAGSELGGTIGSFQITIGSGAGEIDLQLVAQSPFTLEVIDIDTGQTMQSTQGNLTLNGASIPIYPTPSAISAMSVFGLLASRRKRRDRAVLS